jgi:hypothetical protein
MYVYIIIIPDSFVEVLGWESITGSSVFALVTPTTG